MPFRPDQPELGVFTLRTDSRFALFFENGRRQPTPDQVPAYLALGPSQLVTSESGPLGDAVIVSINEG